MLNKMVLFWTIVIIIILGYILLYNKNENMNNNTNNSDTNTNILTDDNIINCGAYCFPYNNLSLWCTNNNKYTLCNQLSSMCDCNYVYDVSNNTYLAECKSENNSCNMYQSYLNDQVCTDFCTADENNNLNCGSTKSLDACKKLFNVCQCQFNKVEQEYNCNNDYVCNNFASRIYTPPQSNGSAYAYY